MSQREAHLVETDGEWYYIGDEGFMETGWLWVNGEWYYLNEDGAMETGWIEDQGKRYYLDVHGAMQTGWVESNGAWYYMEADGSMVSGTKKMIRGVEYEFSKNNRSFRSVRCYLCKGKRKVYQSDRGRS